MGKIIMTHYLIITSTKDKASLNIRDKLLDSKSYKFTRSIDKWHNNALFELEEITSGDPTSQNLLDENSVFLGTTNKRLIFLDDLKLNDSNIDPDILIFASRHASKTGRPSFLVHTTGNWGGDIRYGGKRKELSQASALILKSGYLSLVKNAQKRDVESFSIDIEVSHHGPTTLERPLLFIELGSRASEWHDNEGGIVVADAIIDAIKKYEEFRTRRSQKIGVGFGGTHYAPQFQKLIKEHDVAISYICPKYFIKGLDRDLISQMINKNVESVDFFILDWSGINSDGKKHLIPLLEEFEIPLRKIKEF
jgi:D-aminoacyl-tRNA deacylase